MRWALTLGLLTGLASCGGAGASSMETPHRVVTFPQAGAILKVRVADSADERTRGLMDVQELPFDEGMVFVWEEPVNSTFWMKDTPIPLSIAFVSPDGRIVTIRDMEPCAADPCPTYASGAPFVMAIEANVGFFDEQGISTGDRAVLGANDG